MLKLHPFTAIIFSLVFFCAILFYNNPIYIAAMVTFLIIGLIILEESKKLKNALKYSLFIVIFIIIINPLVSNRGVTVIYEGFKLPIIGRFKITLEAIVFGIVMGARLISMILVFVLYGALVDVDDSLSFFSKYAHRLTLTLAMTTNIIHRFRLEIMRVKDVMILRGAKLNERNIFKRIRAYYPILKVVLITSLEGSLNRAETLYSRGYGKGKRSFYSRLVVKSIDYILIALSLILLGLIIYGIFTNKGSYSYYPRLTSYGYRDIMFLIIMNIPIIISLALIWGCRRWKSLKYKI